MENVYNAHSILTRIHGFSMNSEQETCLFAENFVFYNVRDVIRCVSLALFLCYNIIYVVQYK